MTLPLLLIALGLGLFAATALLWQGWLRRQATERRIKRRLVEVQRAQTFRDREEPWGIG